MIGNSLLKRIGSVASMGSKASGGHDSTSSLASIPDARTVAVLKVNVEVVWAQGQETFSPRNSPLKTDLKGDTGRITLDVAGAGYELVSELKSAAFQLAQELWNIPVTFGPADFVLMVTKDRTPLNDFMRIADLPTKVPEFVGQPVPLPLIDVSLVQRDVPILSPLHDVYLKLCTARADLRLRNSGSVVVVEGGCGVGKTRVLQDIFIKNQQSYPDVTLLVAQGHPFENGPLSRPFGVWMTVCNELVDNDMPILSSTQSAADSRTAAVRRRVLSGAASLASTGQLARHVPSEDNLYVLNSRLRVNFSPPKLGGDEQSKMDSSRSIRGRDSSMTYAEDRCRTVCDFLVPLVVSFGSELKLMIVFDNAHHIDRWSWQVALRVAKLVPQVAMVLALRESNVSSRLAHQLEYQELKKLAREKDRLVEIGRLPREHALLLARQALCVKRLSPALQNLLEHKAQGNPLAIEQLIEALKEKDLIVLRSRVEQLSSSRSNSRVSLFNRSTRRKASALRGSRSGRAGLKTESDTADVVDWLANYVMSDQNMGGGGKERESRELGRGGERGGRRFAPARPAHH